MDDDPHKLSDLFRRMATKIDNNIEISGIGFGGAAVIVPPFAPGPEKSVEILLLDASGDPAQFLSTVMSRIQIMLKEIDDKQRFAQAGFPR
jgi:hypothetical protein